MFDMRDKYSSSLIKDEETKFQKMKYYKVDWTQVSNLVARRNVFIIKGMAFVPEVDLVSIIQNRFRANLSKNLAIGQRSLPSVMEDKRVASILKNLQNSFLGPDYCKTLTLYLFFK